MAQREHETPPPYTRAARPTTPLEPGSLPISEDTEIPVRNTCWRCHGQRTIDDVGYVRCTAPGCGKASRMDRVTTRGHDWVVLLCGHGMRSGLLDIRYEPCPTCGGAGTLQGWKRLGSILDWLDEQYPAISQVITAVRRTLP